MKKSCKILHLGRKESLYDDLFGAKKVSGHGGLRKGREKMLNLNEKWRWLLKLT